jgi:hypothetical protein
LNIKQATRNIKIASILSAIAIPASFLQVGPTEISFYLFMPWLFPGILMLPELAVVSVLTFMLYKKSRVAVVSLFVIFVLDRAFTYLWLHDFGRIFTIAWFCTSLLWCLIFVQGIRGAFAYHRLKSQITSDATQQLRAS